MQNSCLSQTAQYPILLDKNQQLTKLIVVEAHRRVMHDGVKETLTELRSNYWLVRGRQFTRKVIYGCFICKRHEGKRCRPNPPPPLPEIRAGVDFALSL